MAGSQTGGRRPSQPKRRFANAEKKIRHGEWSLLAASSEQGPGQLVISIPKRLVRSAVDRNAIKRQVREAYRNCTRQQRLPVDVLVIRIGPRGAEGRVKGPEREAIRQAIQRLLRRFFDQTAPMQMPR